MKAFIVFMLVAAATAAVFPSNGLSHRREPRNKESIYLLSTIDKVASEHLAPSAKAAQPDLQQQTSIKGDDGYQYKTVRRLKYRSRRDVSELAPEYLPPAEEAVTELSPEYLPPVEEAVTEAAVEAETPQDSAVLGEDGYQYKTVRRLKYRSRRDVSELSPQYLPPAEEAVTELSPDYLPPAEEAVTEAVVEAETPQDSAFLGEDGYQYKTVRRLKYRNRRDVSELSPQYLPPAEEAVTEAAVEAETPQDSAVLGEDGYQYKTVRRLKYRSRRDVSELSPQYLPPAEEAVTELSPEYLPPAEEAVTEAVVEAETPQDSAVLGEDGYQYKTVRRLKYRSRRDVSELSPQYLPPAEEAVTELSPEYLPPAEEAVTEAVVEAETPQDSAFLGEDGYQYKTVRRLKYRNRRDVSELSPQYLPPAEEAVTEVAVQAETPQDSAVLGEDGYQYKTVRRLKYRNRRDVSELSPQYLPPAEEAVTEVAVQAETPQDSAVLGGDGYQYKTVRRLKYRNRRDVSELSSQYLPPAEEAVTEAAVEAETPQDSAVLGEDGYQYKTVRRLKYRNRREVF